MQARSTKKKKGGKNKNIYPQKRDKKGGKTADNGEINNKNRIKGGKGKKSKIAMTGKTKYTVQTINDLAKH